MTRKEIEKQVREQMQQTITDKEALWAKIESRLPEQKPGNQPAPKLKRSMLRQVLAAAACLLLAAAGLSIWTGLERPRTSFDLIAEAPADYQQGAGSAMSEAEEEQNDLHYAYGGDEGDAEEEAEAEPEAPAEGNAAAPKAEESDSGMLTYDDLHVDARHSLADSVDRTLLEADGGFFSLAGVLEDTEVFADVQVFGGEQDKETGEITYTVQVLETYGDEDLPEVLTLSTGSPYLMEATHRYVLPLCRDADGWRLTDDSAPQMERTLDDKVLIHNGWYLLTENSVPVLCEQSGADDYFYDRMCLIDAETLETFLNGWADGSQ